MTGHIHISHLIRAVVFITVLVSGCIFSASEKAEKKASLFSLNLKEGQTVKVRDLEVTWRGDERYTAYQYSLDGVISAWIDTTTVVFTDLNEGSHLFTLQARSDTVLSAVETVNFAVDAIAGPGLVLTPRRITGTTYITLEFENVKNLMAAHIELVCEDDCAEISGFTASSLSEEYGNVVMLNDERDPSRFILDVGFGGLPGGVRGSFNIGFISASPLKTTGTITVDATKTVFRDTNNNTIELNGLDMVRIGM